MVKAGALPLDPAGAGGPRPPFLKKGSGAYGPSGVQGQSPWPSFLGNL
jgi:hypothetical protein